MDDERESPSYRLMDILSEAGAKIGYFDPYLPTIPKTRENAKWEGFCSVEWNQETIAEFDIMLIATAHRNISYQELADWGKCIVDTRNVMAGVSVAAKKVWKA